MSVDGKCEMLHRKINSARLIAFRQIRNKRLKEKSFTILSNNCWGGMVYQAYDLEKQSPTIGSFFYASEYILFLEHLREALNGELYFITPEESKHWEVLKTRNDVHTFPIGVLPGGAEICFLHYHTEDEAREKWRRRCERIHWDKMIVKFNDQNMCTEKEIIAFDKLVFDHKLLFTCKDWPIDRRHYIKIHQFPAGDYLQFSWEPFCDSVYINLTKLINSL